MKATTERTRKLRQLGWFVLLWGVGVIGLSLVAFPLRWAIRAIYGGG